MSEELQQTLRLMAWERAKGELRSIGHAAYGGGDNMQLFLGYLEDFIECIEDDGLLVMDGKASSPS